MFLLRKSFNFCGTCPTYVRAAPEAACESAKARKAAPVLDFAA
jgi:hypothetical protein